MADLTNEAKKMIFTKVEEAWGQVDTARNRVQALVSALELAAKNGVATDAYLLEIIEDTMIEMWGTVDVLFSDLRDELGIKRADYAMDR